MFPFFQILQVAFMPIRLLLKADMKVGLCPISVFEIQGQPFYAIPDEEWDVEQFLLLGGMDQLMV